VKHSDFVVIAAVLAIPSSALGQTACEIRTQEIFQPQNKKVVLASRPDGNEKDQFVLFKSSLRVNTDGAPNSYHPDDLKGSTKAINNIANGVSVTKDGKGVGYAETINIFGQFRANNWTIPAGYKITWGNVLAARVEGGRRIPCIFKSGDYNGYFGSLTALKNGLSSADDGKCEVRNQLDERFVPALVIAGGRNPLKNFKVVIGDLLVVMNYRCHNSRCCRRFRTARQPWREIGRIEHGPAPAHAPAYQLHRGEEARHRIEANVRRDRAGQHALQA
jgi:hypothetical protein